MKRQILIRVARVFPPTTWRRAIAAIAAAFLLNRSARAICTTEIPTAPQFCDQSQGSGCFYLAARIGNGPMHTSSQLSVAFLEVPWGAPLVFHAETRILFPETPYYMGVAKLDMAHGGMVMPERRNGDRTNQTLRYLNRPVHGGRAPQARNQEPVEPETHNELCRDGSTRRRPGWEDDLLLPGREAAPRPGRDRAFDPERDKVIGIKHRWR